MQNLTPLALTLAEKSVTLNKHTHPKQTNKQTANDNYTLPIGVDDKSKLKWCYGNIDWHVAHFVET